jgi:hypothetical protein
LLRLAEPAFFAELSFLQAIFYFRIDTPLAASWLIFAEAAISSAFDDVLRYSRFSDR